MLLQHLHLSDWKMETNLIQKYLTCPGLEPWIQRLSSLSPGFESLADQRFLNKVDFQSDKYVTFDTVYNII